MPGPQRHWFAEWALLSDVENSSRVDGLLTVAHRANETEDLRMEEASFDDAPDGLTASVFITTVVGHLANRAYVYAENTRAQGVRGRAA
jgi:hypothetical protein